MKIDGRAIAAQIFAGLRERVGELQAKGITPKLGVILVGEDPASEAYVMQKQLKADNINAAVEIFQYPVETTTGTLLDKIRLLNQDSTIHGIIVQRPLPPQINPDILEEEIIEAKDVDGFKNGSPFYVPVVLAVLRILGEIYKSEIRNPKSEINSNVQNQNDQNAPAAFDAVLNLENSDFDIVSSFDIRDSDFLFWLKAKKVVLIGKGSTAGKPLMDYFNEKGIVFQMIDSRTDNPSAITKQADIIISSVGKGSIITPDMIKQGVALIGIGIHRGEDSKLHGDYEEEQIKDIAALYTPTPGGVGPINVAMLLENLVTAAEQV